MNAVFADASAATVEVARRNGVEILTPVDLVCCGAPQADLGEFDIVRKFARTNIAALEATGADVICADGAGCSAMVKEYGQILGDDPLWADRAREIARRTIDFSQLVARLIPDGPRLGRLAQPMVTYHEPCHLAHAQRIRQQPRAALGAIPGIEFVEMAAPDRCCGSAGTYAFRRSAESDALLERKVATAAETNADLVVTANPGCMGQLEMGLRKSGSRQRVRHLSEVLLEAYEGAEVDNGG